MDIMFLLLFRVIERILAVLVGGFSIYLGYRLFVEIPSANNSSGKLALPGDISIFFSRVGPGVFFSLFGAAIVTVSLSQGLDLKADVASEGAKNTSNLEVNYANDRVGGDTDAVKLSTLRTEARRSIAELNKFPALLPADTPKTRVIDVMQAVQASKLALLETVWGKDWGEFAKFRNWAHDNDTDPVPAGVSPDPVKIYREVRK